MIWAFLSVLSGLFDAVCFALMKKLRNFNALQILSLRCYMTLPFVLVALFFYEIPKVVPSFYLILSINAVIALVGYYLIIKSLHDGSISKSIPILSFSPVFLIGVSYILAHELPSRIGVAGILLVVAGSYIMNMRLSKENILEPFMIMFRNKNAFYMLVAAFLFSISATISKIGIQMSNAGFFMVMHYGLSSLLLIPAFSFSGNRSHLAPNFVQLLMLGGANAATELLFAIAVKLALVSYIIALKRTSVIFSVLIGFLFFKEKNFSESIMGASIMFAGAALILFA